jgi:fumarate reductase subunit D
VAAAVAVINLIIVVVVELQEDLGEVQMELEDLDLEHLVKEILVDLVMLVVVMLAAEEEVLQHQEEMRLEVDLGLGE